MKLKYILIIIGSMTLLLGIMGFLSSGRGRMLAQSDSILLAVAGLAVLLFGVFYEKLKVKKKE